MYNENLASNQSIVGLSDLMIIESLISQQKASSVLVMALGRQEKRWEIIIAIFVHIFHTLHQEVQ